MIQKYSNVEAILDCRQSERRLEYTPESGEGDLLNKFAALEKEKDSGYLYVRCRAISSRVNKNNDGWESEELAKAYKSFVGKPIFVDHNNDDPKRTRGVIIDARLHVEDDEKVSALDPFYSNCDPEFRPPTWVELLLEVDAKTYPKLAKAIKEGDIDAVSMGANIQNSVCSVCRHEASKPEEYCDHIKNKGAEFEVTSGTGEKEMKKAFEFCRGIGFFEISKVFDPADETADILEHVGKTAAIEVKHTNQCPECKGTNVDKILKEAWDNDNLYKCLDCKKNYRNKNASLEKEGVGGLEDDEHDEGYEVPIEEIHPGEGEEYDLPGAQGDPYAQMPEPQKMEQNLLMNWMRILPNNPEKAQELAQRQLQEGVFPEAGRPLDWHAVENVMRQMMERGYDPETAGDVAVQIFSHLRKEALQQGEQEYERQLNYEPQSDKITTPPAVNTLRDEQKCPNCKSAYLKSDPDGIMKCPECFYSQPPHPMDNPDLGAHQHEQLQEENQEQQSQDPHSQIRNMDFSQVQIVPRSSSTNKKENTKGRINRMKWTTVQNEASVDTYLENPDGINSKTYELMRENKLQAKIKWPTGDTTNIPFDNPLKDVVYARKAQTGASLPSIAEVPITVETSLKDLERVLEIIHTGATTTNPPKKIINPNLQSKTDDPKDARIVQDEHAPVTSKEDMEKESLTLEITEDKEEEKKEEEVKAEADTEAETEEESEEEKESKLLVAFTIADELIELNAIEVENKYAFVGELEDKTSAHLEGMKEAIALLKEAKSTPAVNKVAGLANSLPRMASFVTESNNGSSDDIPFEALFYNG